MNTENDTQEFSSAQTEKIDNNYSELSQDYKNELLKTISDLPADDPKAINILDSLEKIINKELIVAKKMGDYEKESQLLDEKTDIKMANQSLKQKQRERESMILQQEQEDLLIQQENAEKDQATAEFVKNNQYLIESSPNYNEELSNFVKDKVEIINELLEKDGKANMICTPTYYEVLQDEIKEYVKSYNSQKNQSKVQKSTGIAPAFSIKESINKYLDQEKVKLTPEKEKLLELLKFEDPKTGQYIYDRGTKLKMLNEAEKNIVMEHFDQNSVRFKIKGTPKTFK